MRNIKYISKKRIMLPTILALAVLVVGILSVTSVSAQEGQTYPTIVERLAEKFNLNEDEVQAVFEEVRDEHRADMFAEFSERLDALVADGKLTEEQKQYLLDYHTKMEGMHEELQNLTPAERKEKMQAAHEELVKWAEENNLNLKEIMPFRIMRGGMKHGMMFRQKLELQN